MLVAIDERHLFNAMIVKNLFRFLQSRLRRALTT